MNITIDQTLKNKLPDLILGGIITQVQIKNTDDELKILLTD